MAFNRLMATSAGRSMRIGVGLVLLVVCSLLGGVWWIMSALGVLAVATSTRRLLRVAAVAAELDGPACSTGLAKPCPGTRGRTGSPLVWSA
jgi:hypothetical protein